MDAFCHRYTHNNGFSIVLIIFCTAQVFLLSKVIMEILYKTTCNIKYGASGVMDQVLILSGAIFPTKKCGTNKTVNLRGKEHY